MISAILLKVADGFSGKDSGRAVRQAGLYKEKVPAFSLYPDNYFFLVAFEIFLTNLPDFFLAAVFFLPVTEPFLWSMASR